MHVRAICTGRSTGARVQVTWDKSTVSPAYEHRLYMCAVCSVFLIKVGKSVINQVAMRTVLFDWCSRPGELE